MALAFDNKIFFHLPKTGGNYTRSVLECMCKNHFEVGHPHCGPIDIYHQIGKAETFCIVRHPLNWYESLYRFFRRKRVPPSPQTPGFIVATANEVHRAATFEEYVNTIMDNYWFGYATAIYSRYVPYVDHILHTENLTHELKNLLNRWKYSTKINEGKTNVTDKSIDTTLTPGTRKKLLEKEAGIIHYLGYELSN